LALIAAPLAPVHGQTSSLPGLVADWPAWAIGQANGTPVASWTEVVNGYTLSASGSAQPTFVVEGLGGLPEVAFDGHQYLSIGSRATSAWDTGFTIYVVRTEAPGKTGYSVSFGGNDFAFNDTTSAASVNAQVRLPVLTGVGGPNETKLMDAPGGITAVDEGAVDVESYSFDGTSAIFVTNGHVVATTSTAALNLVGAFAVGGSSSKGASGFDGDISEVILCDQAHSEAQQLVEQSYLVSEYRIPLLTIVACDGDSIMSGEHGTPPPTILAGALVQGSYWIENASVAGNPFEIIAARGPEVDATFTLAGQRPQGVVIANGGGDDFTAQSTAAHGTTVYNEYVAYGLARQSAGELFIPVTETPRGNAMPPNDGWTVAEGTLNGDIEPNWPAFANAVADIAGGPPIRLPGDNENTIYYYSDAIHLLPAGDNLYTPYIENALTSIGIP
jgi:hypothetical protein